MNHDLFGTRKEFETGHGEKGIYYSLPALEEAGFEGISRLPVSIRIVLESVLRNFDGGRKISETNVSDLARWAPGEDRTAEIPFVVARVILQDFTGVPLLVDLAAMRSAVKRMGKDPGLIEPLVPVDLVIDHSVQVDYFGNEFSYQMNIEKEFERNEQRYRFLKWGTQAFSGFRVIPPGIGIVHQVNLEYLARGVFSKGGVYYPDTLVGTDSHTTMINGIGIVGWGVGGIEAEAAMLGQPVYFLTPDVVGVNISGSLPEGSTATDVVLRVTELLRKHNVVGKFVEFFGEGAAALNATDRATIANMAPEYGATMGFFGVDEKTLDYYRNTGRDERDIATVKNYFKAQGLFGIPASGDVDYSSVVELDLGSIVPSVAGPKRPQDRIELTGVKEKFLDLLVTPIAEGGFGKESGEAPTRYSITGRDSDEAGLNDLSDVSSLGHGDVVIAAITSCTNTSNPSVMMAAGLVAKKAVERGMKVPGYVKTSLAPGSRVVTEYLEKAGLQQYLNDVGFDLVGYGCTTCIGNSGPLDPRIEKTITSNDMVVASVLSGNRNFEARVHQNVRANFLMSPPLVVAFALAGRIVVDPVGDPIGIDGDGNEVFLADIWPTMDEVASHLSKAYDAETYRKLYSEFAEQNPLWNNISSSVGQIYEWDPDSTYIQEPPFFSSNFGETGFKDISGARALAIFGDSVTTDHISPAGAIKPDSPAGSYLQSLGVDPADFNSYGSRRGNDRVMLRGTFANVRIKNLMAAPTEGGFTRHQPDGTETTIYDAAMKYREENIPLVIFAGKEYGTGSSRDWAAKGTALMGVRAVVAESFERIHRSNLVGMGVLPLQFKNGESASTLGLDGTEFFDITGLEEDVAPQQDITLRVRRLDGTSFELPVQLRIDTPIELEYYNSGGILPYVLGQIIGEN
ncbi:MAG: aconitate hydratase AcnA [Acidobacteriota bacterium]|nr:MAG: aconitate hydratase AcnA [Acidobacteriota bacterium]